MSKQSSAPHVGLRYSELEVNSGKKAGIFYCVALTLYEVTPMNSTSKSFVPNIKDDKTDLCA